MRRPSFLTLVFTLSCALVPAQSWVARFDGPANGDDQLVASAVDSMGRVILAGNSGPARTSDFAVVAIDPGGARLWATVIDGPAGDQDLLSDLAIDDQGDVYVTGRASTQRSGSDYFTVKLRGSDGAVEWSVNSDGGARSIDQANAIAVGAGHEVFVTGLSYNGDGDADFLTLCYDAAGRERWRARYAGPGPLGFRNDHARDLAVDGNGDAVITGFSPDRGGIDDYATLKYRGSDGARLWRRRYTGAGANDAARRVAVDANGDVYVSGESFQSGWKVATLKYDGSAGAVLWETLDDPGVREQLGDLVLDGSGSFYLAGRADPDADESNVNDDAFAVRRSTSTGALDWQRRIGGSGFNQLETASSVTLGDAGEVLLAGAKIVKGASTDALLLRLRASDGVLLSSVTWDGPAGDADGASAVHRLGPGAYVACGVSVEVGSAKDFVAVLYTDDDVVLSIDPALVRAGDELLFEVSPGAPGSPMLLAVASVDGAPLFAPVTVASLDQHGRRLLSATVPPGLTGLDVGFAAFTLARSGRAARTAERAVAFR